MPAHPHDPADGPTFALGVVPAWPGFRWAGWEWRVAGGYVELEGYCRTRLGARRHGRQVVRSLDPSGGGRAGRTAPVTAIAAGAARRARTPARPQPTGAGGSERRSA